jgi:shikimate dehydrogenase
MIRAAVLGSDVSKSRSPAIHNAAFKALGIDGEYVARSVDAAGFRQLATELCSEGYSYANVTIPHKQAAAKLANKYGPEVLASGAANTLLFKTPVGPVHAENTDGAGLIAALADIGVLTVTDKTIAMVGAGGAAAGAIEALTRAGAFLKVIARRPEVARGIQQRLPPPQSARVLVLDWNKTAFDVALSDADILVSAVPAAAWSDLEVRDPIDSLSPEAAIFEMAYGQPSPLAGLAQEKGAVYADGLSMLVHQAARAIELALGRKPPLAPLFEAVARGS